MMIDGAQPIEDLQPSDMAASEDVEELRSEDAEVEINFDEAATSSGGTAASQGEEQPTAEMVDPADGGGQASETASAVDVDELTRQVAMLKAQVEDRTSQYMRIAADFENYRKRTSKEKEDLEVQLKCSTISELLPVVDNFERARAQIKPQTDAEMAIHKSYQSVYKQLVEGLKRLGVAPMRAEGQPFDPGLHEAVMREATSEYSEGTVMEELVRGYLLGDRVLRHAMVKVASSPEPSDAGGDSPADG